MVKFYKSTSVYPYPWVATIRGFWFRYPNPFSTHVVSEDTLVREVRDGKLYTKRLITKTNSLPNWGKHLFWCKENTNNFIPVIEESIVDPENQTMTTYTRNVGFSTRVLDVSETVVYKPDSEGTNSSNTLVLREASVSSSVYGLTYALEQFGVRRFKKNCEKAASGFLHVLNRIYGIAGVEHDSSNLTNMDKAYSKLTEAKLKFNKAKQMAQQSGKIFADCDYTSTHPD